MGRIDKAGRQAVHHVAQAGQKSALLYLVQDLGVAVNATSSRDQETPLHAAAKVGLVYLTELQVEDHMKMFLNNDFNPCLRLKEI